MIYEILDIFYNIYQIYFTTITKMNSVQSFIRTIMYNRKIASHRVNRKNDKQCILNSLQNIQIQPKKQGNTNIRSFYTLSGVNQLEKQKRGENNMLKYGSMSLATTGGGGGGGGGFFMTIVFGTIFATYAIEKHKQYLYSYSFWYGS